ncbi:MAG: hypothetical protein AAB909_03585 [Patescibacteria group bacterium]
MCNFCSEHNGDAVDTAWDVVNREIQVGYGVAFFELQRQKELELAVGTLATALNAEVLEKNLDWHTKIKDNPNPANTIDAGRIGPGIDDTLKDVL